MASGVSPLLLIIGFTCGYICRKHNKRRLQEEENTPNVLYEEVGQSVDLKQNLAYGPSRSIITAKV